MSAMRLALATMVLLAFCPSVSFAQAWKFWEWGPEKQLEGPNVCGEGVPVSEACQKEFDDWLSEDEKWRKIYTVWANYPIYRGLRTPLRGNIKRPVVPWWIRSRCISELEMGLLVKTRICEEYEKAIRYDWVMHIEGPGSNVSFTNKVTVGMGDGNRFLEFLLKNLHFDPILTNSSDGPRIWGFAGSHLTIAHMGRFYFWGPPGFIALKLPDGTWSFRLTYGADFYLGKILVPIGDDTSLPIYIIFAKALTKGDLQAVRRGIDSGINMVGISVTIK